MKNVYEILKEFGLEIPEDKREEFDKLWKENYRTKAEYDNAVTKRDEYKESLDTVNGKLKEFEDVDVDDLKNQITKLQNNLKEKDDEYAAKESERLFNESLDNAITASGGRNVKAIRGMLDIATLQESKNQTEDIKKALETIKESDAYLFGADEPINSPVGPTGGSRGIDATTAAMRAAAGLPPEK